VAKAAAGSIWKCSAPCLLRGGSFAYVGSLFGAGGGADGWARLMLPGGADGDWSRFKDWGAAEFACWRGVAADRGLLFRLSEMVINPRRGCSGRGGRHTQHTCTPADPTLTHTTAALPPRGPRTLFLEEARYTHWGECVACG